MKTFSSYVTKLKNYKLITERMMIIDEFYINEFSPNFVCFLYSI